MRPDEDDPEAPPSLGDVEEYLLDGTESLPRGVLVQLVEDQEQHLVALAGLFLVFERLSNGDTDHEAFRPVVEIVDVDNGHLMARQINLVPPGVRNITADQPLDVSHRPHQATHKRVDRARAYGRAGPRVSILFALHLRRDEVGELSEGPNFFSFDPDPAIVQFGGAAELGHHVVNHHGVLSPVVLCVRKQKRQEIALAELGDRPEERRDAGEAGADVWDG